MCAVVREHGVDLVGNGGGKGSQEVAGHPAGRPFVQLDEGELGRPVDRHEQVQPAFLGVHLGDVEVEVAERVALELGAQRLVASTSGSREMPWRWRQRWRADA